MNAQIPIPSFDEIRKVLNFWFDQKDKWFYFETEMFQIGIDGDIQKMSGPYGTLYRDITNEMFQYSQSRIVGKIYDVIEYPPSLLLRDVTVFTANINSSNRKGEVVDLENRKQYGLIFSQISYYEPIEDVASFISNDARIRR